MRDETLSVIVKRKYAAATEITCLELISKDGEALPSFEAGSHVDLHIGAYVRQYSLCSSPSATDVYRLAIKLEIEGRGGSQAVHRDIAEGDTLTISTPRNNFPLAEGAQHSILIAGGIGVTPMLAMAQSFHEKNQSFELHYCCRSSAHAAFYAELAAADFASHIHFHFDDGEDEQRLNLQTILSHPASDRHLYVCGPDGFMAFVTNTAQDELAWADECVHIESFSAADLSQDGDETFTVTLASSGQSFKIPPDQTVVDVLAEGGIDIPLSCEQGICGTCLTQIVKGTPDHRDMYLTDAEKEANDQFTPCCSRSLTSELVLDL